MLRVGYRGTRSLLVYEHAPAHVEVLYEIRGGFRAGDYVADHSIQIVCRHEKDRMRREKVDYGLREVFETGALLDGSRIVCAGDEKRLLVAVFDPLELH